MIQRRLIPTYIFLGIVSFISVFPLYWMISAATNTSTDVSRGRLLPGTHFMENFKNLMSQQPLWRALGNSFLYAILTTVLCLLVCSIAGYGFEIYHDKWKDRLFSILLLAMMIPQVATMVPLFQMFSKAKLLNTAVGFMLPIISTPFMIMMFRQNARAFPVDIIEALKKVRTRKSYFKYISDICNYLKKDFTAIDESEAQNYFSQLAETKSYEPKYLHLRLSACRSVASYIEKNAQHFNLKNYLSPFVFVDLPEYSDNIHKSDIPSIKQMNTVLSATEDDIMMFTIISICFRCALTVSEICNLKFSDVVEDDLGRLCFIVKGSKSPRVVKIPDDVKEILFRYVDQYPGEDFLFRNSKNQKLLTRTLQYRLRSIMDRADLSKTFTFQDIRNAAIIYMRQGGVTNADLVKYAGLSSEKWVSRFDGVIDGLDLAPCDYSHISIKY